MARWQPDAGHPQVDLTEAPTFRPSREEFADPFTYIANIAEQFVKQGIAKIVPPKGAWAVPPHVQQLRAACGSGGGSSLGAAPTARAVGVQRQFVSHLCVRDAPGAMHAAAAAMAASTSTPGDRCVGGRGTCSITPWAVAC